MYMNGQDGQEWAGMETGMDRNGQGWTGMVRDGQEWSGMDRNGQGQECTGMGRDGHWTGMVRYGNLLSVHPQVSQN